MSEGDTWDAASIRLRMVDQNGNLCPYYQEPVTLTASGAIELIGSSLTSFKGGMTGSYVRTTGKTGEGKLTVTTESETQEFRFLVERA